MRKKLAMVLVRLARWLAVEVVDRAPQIYVDRPFWFRGTLYEYRSHNVCCGADGKYTLQLIARGNGLVWEWGEWGGCAGGNPNAGGVPDE